MGDQQIGDEGKCKLQWANRHANAVLLSIANPNWQTGLIMENTNNESCKMIKVITTCSSVLCYTKNKQILSRASKTVSKQAEVHKEKQKNSLKLQ